MSVDTDERGRVHLRQAPFRLNATLDCATTQTFWIPIRRGAACMRLPPAATSHAELRGWCLPGAALALPPTMPCPLLSCPAPCCSYVTSSAPDELKWTVLKDCATKDPFFVL